MPSLSTKVIRAIAFILLTKNGKGNDMLIEDLIRKKLNVKEARLFGGNALFAFESAILKALAREQKKELWEIVNPHATKFPRPVGNVIGGGLHTKGKIKPVFQEFLLIPREKTFSDNVNVMKKT